MDRAERAKKLVESLKPMQLAGAVVWGKPKPEPAAPKHLCIPCPRMTEAEKRLELVLCYVERMLGHPMSMMDARVLITLIRAANEEGRCDNGAGTEGPGEVGGEVPEEGG